MSLTTNICTTKPTRLKKAKRAKVPAFFRVSKRIGVTIEIIRMRRKRVK